MVRSMVFVFLITATAAWAQDPPPADEPATEAEPEAVGDLSEEESEEFDFSGQEDHTEEDEDVFTPTDVVTYEQSVAFPVDI